MRASPVTSSVVRVLGHPAGRTIPVSGGPVATGDEICNCARVVLIYQPVAAMIGPFSFVPDIPPSVGASP